MLTLLQTAQEQRRAWHVIAFSGREDWQPLQAAIRYEQTILPGEATLESLLPLLLHRADGGTCFEAPLTRALEVLETAPSIRRADLIFITDGEGHVPDALVVRLNAAHEQHGLMTYAIGIGAQAKLRTLRPFAQEIYHLSSNPNQDSAEIAPVLALVS